MSGGFSSFGVLRIVQERKRGDELRSSGYVVKYLKIKDLRDEIRVHEKEGLLGRYPLRFTPGEFIDSWPASGELSNAPDDKLGAVYYHLATLEKDSQLRTLTDIYCQSSFPEIEPYLVQLFDERLLPWYGRGHNEEQIKPLGGVTGEYGRLYRHRQRIQEYIGDLLGVPHQKLSSVDSIDIPFLPKPWQERDYYNPISWILKVLAPGNAECFRADCRYSPVHGDLHSDNILIEEGQHTHIWLIDFPNAHVGPALVDFATLEANVKFRLLTEEHCNFEDWLTLEEQLLTPLRQSHRITLVAPWHGDWRPQNDHLWKAWEFVGFLRDRVVRYHLMGIDVRAYYLALLHATMPVVYRHHTEFQKQCALTSAAWMCEYLSS
jgi:hypothetical protein